MKIKKKLIKKPKEKTKEKNMKYQFSNDHKHKLKFKNRFFEKNIISIKKKSKLKAHIYKHGQK